MARHRQADDAQRRVAADRGGDRRRASAARAATATVAPRRRAGARPRGQRIRREARRHQPRRQGGEGRPALRLRRARRGRRQQGPRRLRLGQGARSAGGDPQGDRAGAPRHDPRAAARRPHACITTSSAITAPARSSARGAARHRHHRRRPDARDLRGAGRAGRGGEIGRHLEPAQHDQGDLRGAQPLDQPALGRGAPRQEGQRHPRPRAGRRGAGVRR